MNKFNVGQQVDYLGAKYEVTEYDVMSNVYGLKNEFDTTGAHEDDLKLVTDNKFNIGDKVMYDGAYEYSITDLELRIDGYYYTVEQQLLDGINQMWTHERNLGLIEHKPTDKEIATDTSYEETPKQKESLDYEKEYKLLLEEYEDLNEELYIAKTAIKMLSELL
jgi:hypothetical protein